MKQLCLIFCGEDGDAAKSLAQSIRTDECRTMIVSAYEFNGREWDSERVIIMPDAPRWQADRIAACYPNAERKQKPQVIAFKVPEGIAAPKRRGRPRKIPA